MLGQDTLTLFRSLPNELKGYLGQVGQVREYADKQLICSRGDRDRELNIIEQGMVRLSNVGLEGRRTETAVLEPGDSFGEFTLLAGMPRVFDFHARGQTRIRRISKPQFDALMQQHEVFRDGILQMLTQRLLTAVGIIEDLRRLPLTAQLAKYLLQCSARQAQGQWRYAGTQSDLADALGVSRVSIGQALKVLKQAGLVDSGYRCVEIRDRAALQLWLQPYSSLQPIASN